MALRVKNVDFHEDINAKKHFTDQFELIYLHPGTPILRRGQNFKITIDFENRAFDQNKDKITLLFGLGPNPDATKDTLIPVVLNQFLQRQQETDKDKWFGKILQNSGHFVEAEIIASSNSSFGYYSVQVICQTGNNMSKFKLAIGIWLLFNPWCKDDLVYMPDARLLDEYILSDVGKIWLGPYTTTRGREWAFGQFARHILPACNLLLDRTRVPYQHRGDPIRISRAISKIVNSNDDHGVLVGRWDGDYSDGTAPSAWTGSADILEQFLNTKEEVRYGQCWVFAGVVTTICRAMGIPCRPVSNLVSAHDSNMSLTVDKYYDEDNNELGGDPNNPMSEDSVWNYHVWNDVYMARPDLPKGYGGWQAIDATPQETSDGFYQCGPASVEAIRRGKVGLNYDVPFLISSVNADYVKWKRDTTCVLGYKKIFCNINHIGKMILTKQPWVFDPNGDKDRQDITSLYKHKEGTKDERLALYNAARNTRNAKKYFEMPDDMKEDVKFELADLDKVFMGETIKTLVKLQNTSNENRTVDISLSAASVYYTGNKANVVKRTNGQIKLEPNARRNIHMQIRPEEYAEGLVEYNNMKIYAICTVVETKQTWGAEDDFQIVKPTIKIDASPELSVGSKQQITLHFDNPLEQTITNGIFRVTCPKILARAVPLSIGVVKPKSKVTANYEFPIRKSGQFTIVATFSSRELNDVTGSAQFEVY